MGLQRRYADAFQLSVHDDTEMRVRRRLVFDLRAQTGTENVETKRSGGGLLHAMKRSRPDCKFGWASPSHIDQRITASVRGSNF